MSQVYQHCQAWQHLQHDTIKEHSTFLCALDTITANLAPHLLSTHTKHFAGIGYIFETMKSNKLHLDFPFNGEAVYFKKKNRIKYILVKLKEISTRYTTQNVLVIQSETCST